MNREAIDLFGYLNPSLLEGIEQDQKSKVIYQVYAQQLMANINKDQLYLYYEIRSLKWDSRQAYEVMKKLQALGVTSLEQLQEMEREDLISCDLTELLHENNVFLNPSLQIFLYDNMMNENIDRAIVKLKQYKIKTLEQFFSEDETQLLKVTVIPKYQYRKSKKAFTLNQPNFKTLNKSIKEENENLEQFQQTDQLYLYYEIRSFKQNKGKALAIMQNLQKIGVKSLSSLSSMDEEDLAKCELQDWKNSNQITPQFQTLIYQEMMHDQIDETIWTLKIFQILNEQQFFSENETLLLEKVQIPKYQYRECKKKYMGGLSSFEKVPQKLQKTYQMQNVNNFQNQQKIAPRLPTCQVELKNGFKIKKTPTFFNSQFQNKEEFKTIVFIGSQGSGKTSLINYFLNFYYDVRFEDDFRYKLIKDGPTNDIQTYYIQPSNQKQGLRIVDTQGIGLSQDTEMTNKIKEFLTKEKNLITSICYVYKAPTARIDQNEKSIKEFIMQTFGLRFSKNCFFAFTFSDVANPEAMATLQSGQSKVSALISQIFYPWYYKFNNENLFAHNQEDLKKNIEDYDIQNNKKQWDIQMKNFAEIYHKKLTLTPNITFQDQQENNPTILLSWLNLKQNLYYLFGKLIIIREELCKFDYYRQDTKTRVYTFVKPKERNNTVGSSIFCNICKSVCLYHPNYKNTIETSMYNGNNSYSVCMCGCLLSNHKLETSKLEIFEKVFYSNNEKSQICENYVTVLFQCQKIQSILMYLKQQLNFEEENQEVTLTPETFIDYLQSTETTNDQKKFLQQIKHDWKWFNSFQYSQQTNMLLIITSLQQRWT